MSFEIEYKRLTVGANRRLSAIRDVSWLTMKYPKAASGSIGSCLICSFMDLADIKRNFLAQNLELDSSKNPILLVSKSASKAILTKVQYRINLEIKS
ncbi:hypothetical protein G6F43_008671 [Rhizopus delemar]|nr:hypothetical protein G6F43_008671 [Rhizopus delemar]